MLAVKARMQAHTERSSVEARISVGSVEARTRVGNMEARTRVGSVEARTRVGSVEASTNPFRLSCIFWGAVNCDFSMIMFLFFYDSVLLHQYSNWMSRIPPKSREYGGIYSGPVKPKIKQICLTNHPFFDSYAMPPIYEKD